MADIEALITILSFKENIGRQRPAYSGYRPAHLVQPDYLTTGEHQYESGIVEPGETVKGTITFITPEVYPNSLWIGKIIKLQEGSRLIGYAEVTNIFNELLRKKESGSGNPL
ncbi:elongation factor Tu [Paenibacillus sp. BK033]|uniref:hypothetical protein n=1 Tax=Paenibacillus sp. BK033 TaxID=2512133 RepID=UPI001045958D|nr:hypothetical protein [Paenibacillus sp. BK033]TCM96336.1 elongation factor Tu [Paenibacillus sp. BK033]